MKKFLVVLGVLAIIVGLTLKNKYNAMVTSDEGVQASWSQVENQYQRRMDLIPNLVNTVKGYADFEKETFTAVTEARAKVGQMNVDVKNAEEFAQFQQAQTGLGSALSRLMVVMEKYPDLKANQNFLDLQTQLEGTENRISTERMRFNETVKAYNVLIRRFPNNLVAGMFGFEKANLFEMNEGADVAPTVEF